MAVDRCVCHGVRFAELLRLARDEGLDLDALRRRTGCGTGCGLCVPYIRVALETGRADLPVMSFDETARPRREGGGAAQEKPAD